MNVIQIVCNFCEGTGNAVIDYVESECCVCLGFGKTAKTLLSKVASMWQTKDGHKKPSAVATPCGGEVGL